MLDGKTCAEDGKSIPSSGCDFRERSLSVRRFISIISVIVVSIPLMFLNGCGKETKRAGGAAPVTVAPVMERDVPVELRTFGTVTPLSTVDIKSQASGILTTVHFKEGQDVKKGDMLFTTDPQPYQAALRQAEASKAKAEVECINATNEVARQEALLQKGFVSQGDYDAIKTAGASAAAAMHVAEAALESARIEAEYCFIKSPIDGRTGNLMVHEGNLVKPDDVTLVTVNQIKPIQVEFAVPQQNLPEIIRRMGEGELDVRAAIKGEENSPELGKLIFIDNAIDPSTGTVRLKATFANAEQRLWPGQFVSVTLVLTIQRAAIVVPSCAVQTGQKGTYVFVLKPDMTVESRPVSVARIQGEDSVISDGLKPGEQVVTDGQMRLKPGAAVEIKTADEPKAQR